MDWIEGYVFYRRCQDKGLLFLLYPNTGNNETGELCVALISLLSRGPVDKNVLTVNKEKTVGLCIYFLLILTKPTESIYCSHLILGSAYVLSIKKHAYIIGCDQTTYPRVFLFRILGKMLNEIYSLDYIQLQHYGTIYRWARIVFGWNITSLHLKEDLKENPHYPNNCLLNQYCTTIVRFVKCIYLLNF